MYSKLTQKRMKGIERVLNKDEIICAVPGLCNARNGVLVLTPTQIVFYASKMFGRYQTEEIPVSKISSVSYTKGLRGTTIELYASNNDLKINWIPNREKPEDFVKNIKSQMVNSQTSPG